MSETCITLSELTDILKVGSLAVLTLVMVVLCCAMVWMLVQSTRTGKM